MLAAITSHEASPSKVNLYDYNTTNPDVAILDPQELTELIDQHWGNQDGKVQEQELLDFDTAISPARQTSQDPIFESLDFSYEILSLKILDAEYQNADFSPVIQKLEHAMQQWEHSLVNGNEVAAEVHYQSLLSARKEMQQMLEQHFGLKK